MLGEPIANRGETIHLVAMRLGVTLQIDKSKRRILYPFPMFGDLLYTSICSRNMLKLCMKHRGQSPHDHSNKRCHAQSLMLSEPFRTTNHCQDLTIYKPKQAFAVTSHSSHILPINQKHPLLRLPDFRCPLRLQDFQDVQTGDHHLWMTWTKVRRAPASAFPSTSRPCPWCAVFSTLPTRMQLTSELPFNKGHRGS